MGDTDTHTAVVPTVVPTLDFTAVPTLDSTEVRTLDMELDTEVPTVGMAMDTHTLVLFWIWWIRWPLWCWIWWLRTVWLWIPILGTCQTQLHLEKSESMNILHCMLFV